MTARGGRVGAPSCSALSRIGQKGPARAKRTHAHQNGFVPDLVLAASSSFADHGTSGVSTRLCERPEGRRLFDILRKGENASLSIASVHSPKSKCLRFRRGIRKEFPLQFSRR
jgi:hypothetical protein